MKNLIALAVASLWLILMPAAAQTGPAPAAQKDLAKTVLVFGGTGQLGSAVVKELSAAGHHVWVFARPKSNRKRLNGLAVDYVTGDVLALDTVAAGIASAKPSVVIDALGRGQAGVEFYRDSASNIAKASAAYGVSQLILHGSVGARDSVVLLGQPLSARTKRLFDAKSAGEQAVIDSGVGYTIIRHWQLLRGGTPASGRAVLSPDEMATAAVSRADLAQLTAQCVAAPGCLNQVFHAVQSGD